MAGTIFNYEAGYIDARFSHYEKTDFIQLDIRMDGDTIITTECDDNWQKSEPEFYQKDSVEFSVFMTATSCPFKDFIRFLEAIALGVQECAFRWDAEGPEGEMRWERRFIDDTGFLTVLWSSEEEYNYRMMLNTRQAVAMLYGAFRSFVESSDYDPVRWESLTYGENFELIINDATLDDLSEALVMLNAEAAEAVIQRLLRVVSDRSFHPEKQSFPIEYFLKLDDAATIPSEPEPIIEPDWDSWDKEQRKVSIKSIFDWPLASWMGSNLRQLRSTIIESWLALPEPLSPQNS